MVELEGNGSAGPNGSAEGNGTAGGNGFSEVLPPPPSEIPPDVKPLKVEPPKKKRVPMARKGLGTKGNRIQLLSNHFKVNIGSVDGQFFHYYVNICYEDGHAMDAKGMGRKVIDQVKKTYASDLGGKNFAYDGEKSLFTVGALPRNKLEFDVVLEDVQSARNPGNSSPGNDDADRKRVKRPHRTKSYKVELSYAAKIPMQAIANAIRGQENENTQEALRVLDIILRQHAAKQGCLLVRQSFFHHDAKNYTDVGGGVQGCHGFHTSFRGTQAGLSLNIDVSTTMTVQPGPVVDFLITNQNVRDPSQIDWSKAKRVLKNLRVKATTSNQEYKISGLSDRPCRDQTFTLKRKGDDEETEITVYDYFVNHRKIDLRYSANMPCINVGKPKRPTFIPIELCELVSLQRYTKSLTNLQRAALVEKSRQKPLERMNALNNALRISNYNSDPMLRECGVSIGKDFLQFDGRVLPTPKLKAGNGEDFFPRNGRWNFNNKRLVEPCKVERWAVVNFSARCDPKMIVSGLMKAGQAKGVKIEDPFDIFEENHQVRRAPPVVRVEKMCEQLQAKLPGMPLFLLCLLPERKNCDVYGPWKKKNLAEFGVVTQCMAPFKVNDQYLTNVLLKINAKLGGLNSLLSIERSPTMIVSKVPTIILGMDVSHGSPGHSDVPSIAAVVSSRGWPLISRYRACVRTQSPKVEMIDNLFKPNGAEDEGIIREALIDFYNSSGKRKPEQIIIFRDGVSESQFNQVLNIELDQIIEACKFLDESWNPKFVVIIAQKNHHTKFFQSGGCPDNVPPGTIIDNTVCHPRNYDFYLCAHAGMIGTTRPTHYHVLYDEVGFAADELQELVHSLSYVYQRSTTAISVVAPVCYAHLAATQMSQWMKFEDNSETTSSHGGSGSGGMTSKGPAAVPQLPKLNELVSSSMFFC